MSGLSREHWIGIAAALGDIVMYDDGAVAVMQLPVRKPRNAMHVAILFVLLLLGFVTFFLTWALLLPYLVVVAALNASASSPASYWLWVNPEGRPVTIPSGMVWRLRAENDRLRKMAVR